MDALGIQYSIKVRLTKLNIPAKVHHAELKPPKEYPMVYVISVPSNHFAISKGRETVEALYNYEIILYSDSKSELESLRRKITDILLFDEFEYYDSNGDKTSKKFLTDENTGVSVSPSFVINVENVSNYYQASFDFGVRTTHHKNKGEI